MTSEQDERAFQTLTAQISRARGIGCDAYKNKCLRRRIAVRMRARGVHTFAEYGRLLDGDPGEYDRLLDALTINVTKFYRNAETWRALAGPLLTERWRARQGRLRVWSAGCASGEEPYTIAVVLAELARTLGDEALLPRASIEATDVDRVSLERTAAPEYPATAFTEMPPELVRRYFAAGPLSPPPQQYQPVPAIRDLVRVVRHDLTREPPPHPPYDLIVCRNVVIYFQRPAQERLFDVFASSLEPGGLLLLGKVETLFGPARDRLELVDPRERIYRKRA